MSNLITFLKIAGAATAGTAVVGGSVGFTIWNKNTSLIANSNDRNKNIIKSGTNTKSPNPTIYVVAETVETSDAETQNMITTSGNKNYECQFDSKSENKDTTCELFSITLPTDKKILTIDEITQLTSSTSVTKELLKASGNYFKIKVTDNFYQSVVAGIADKKIQVVLTNPTTGKKLAELKPIFAFKDSIISAKTLYSVGKVSSFSKDATLYDAKDLITITSNASEIKCFFTQNDTNNNEETQCSINKIVENNADSNVDFSTLKFIGSEASQSSIKKGNYYLFKFIEGSEKSAISFKNDAETHVKVNDNTVNKLNVSELVPSVVLGSTDANKTLLLLGNIAKQESN